MAEERQKEIPKRSHVRPEFHPEDTKKNKFVFLGGTILGRNWREELTPKLKIGWYNPIVDNWTEYRKLIERIKRDHSYWNLYVITKDSGGPYSVAEAVEDSVKRASKVVFCFIPDGMTDNEKSSLHETGLLIRRNGGRYVKWEELHNVLNRPKIRRLKKVKK